MCSVDKIVDSGSFIHKKTGGKVADWAMRRAGYAGAATYGDQILKIGDYRGRRIRRAEAQEAASNEAMRLADEQKRIMPFAGAPAATSYSGLQIKGSTP